MISEKAEEEQVSSGSRGATRAPGPPSIGGDPGRGTGRHVMPFTWIRASTARPGEGVMTVVLESEESDRSFIWSRIRTIAQETAFQIALRNCCKEAEGSVYM